MAKRTGPKINVTPEPTGGGPWENPRLLWGQVWPRMGEKGYEYFPGSAWDAGTHADFIEWQASVRLDLLGWMVAEGDRLRELLTQRVKTARRAKLIRESLGLRVGEGCSRTDYEAAREALAIDWTPADAEDIEARAKACELEREELTRQAKQARVFGVDAVVQWVANHPALLVRLARARLIPRPPASVQAIYRAQRPEGKP